MTAAAWKDLPPAILILSLLVATLVAMRYLPWLGFLGASFLLILAPSSSFMPIIQPMFEHRAYLASATVVVTVVLLADWTWGRLAASFASFGRLPAALRWGVPAVVVGALAAGEAYLTLLRNNDYCSDLAIWQDTVRKVPSNYWARNYLANALAARGQADQAIPLYRQVLEMEPRYPDAHYNLGNALASRGQIAEAAEQYRQALALRPHDPDFHTNLGNALASLGQIPEAIDHYQWALKADPQLAEAHNNLGVMLASQGRTAEAVEHYQEALSLNPNYAEAHYNLGNALASQGRLTEAVREYRLALKTNPNLDGARKNLNQVLARIQTGPTGTMPAPAGPAQP
jgi:protein O-mannosyl-transferase